MLSVRTTKLNSRWYGQATVRHLAYAGAALLLVGLAIGTLMIPISDDQIRRSIVEESISAYLASGKTCPCPYSLTPGGLRCVGQSQYGRPGVDTALCYPDDVTDPMVQVWRANHR